jgi:hypothetical protein
VYKIASEKAQRGRERIRVPDLAGNGLPEISCAADRIRDLSRAVDNIQTQIAVAKTIDPPNKAEIKQLGMRKFEIQNEIKELKATQSPKVRGFSQWFVDVAQEMLPSELFEAIKAEARTRTRREFEDAR